MTCVFVFFLTFSAVVIYREITSCLDVVEMLDSDDSDVDDGTMEEKEAGARRLFRLAKKAIHLTQEQRLSGLRSARFLLRGDELGNYPPGGYAFSPDYSMHRKHLTQLSTVNSLNYHGSRVFYFAD